jgi:hypothetical protein
LETVVTDTPTSPAIAAMVAGALGLVSVIETSGRVGGSFGLNLASISATTDHI